MLPLRCFSCWLENQPCLYRG